MLKATALVLALSVFACQKADEHAAAPADAGPAAVAATGAALAVGSLAPDFEAKTQLGTDFVLSAQKGKTVVVYFYPKDETSGCTTEAEAFRDDFDKLQDKGAVVVGISADSIESHKAFAENHKLPFLLVSDPKGEIAAKFGVPFNTVTQRQTFVVGKDGRLLKIYRTVVPAGHSSDVMSSM